MEEHQLLHMCIPNSTRWEFWKIILRFTSDNNTKLLEKHHYDKVDHRNHAMTKHHCQSHHQEKKYKTLGEKWNETDTPMQRWYSHFYKFLYTSRRIMTSFSVLSDTLFWLENKTIMLPSSLEVSVYECRGNYRTKYNFHEVFLRKFLQKIFEFLKLISVAKLLPTGKFVARQRNKNTIKVKLKY